MFKKIAILHAFLLLGNVVAEGTDHSSHDGHEGEGEDHAPMYCAKHCEHHDEGPGHNHRDMRWLESGHDDEEDVCGDGHGQKDECTEVTFGSMATFGYANVTEAFLGCTLHACEDLCVGVTNATAYTVQNETICFPEKSEMDGMYMMQDVAKVASVSRGCEGAHKMGEMWMAGETHSACAESYNTMGVEFGHEDDHSSSSAMGFTLAVAAGIGSLFMFGLVY